MKLFSKLGGALLVVLVPTGAQAKVFKCKSSEEARVEFQSGDLEALPFYDRSPHGAARVQEEHPTTYLFSQSKHLIANGIKGAICQYSNHVGLVSTYYVMHMEPVLGINECNSDNCEGESHWRSEWMNPLTEDKNKSSEKIFVCVKTLRGIEYPSSECHFKSSKAK